MLEALSTAQVLRQHYKEGLWPEVETLLVRNFNPSDTYMMVFSLGQENLLEEFKKLTKDTVKIIFEGKKAYNTTHPGRPRNTLIIFETIEEPK